MTLRRYAPLALSAIALACQPEIDKRTNATTAEYPLFNPAASQLPLPNDIALAQYDSYLTAGANQDASCSAAAAGASSVEEAQQRMALCAYARAGGFPASADAATITLVRGTLGGDGPATYAPPPPTEALDTATLKVGGVDYGPNFVLVDVTTPTTPSLVAVTPDFDATTGVLSVPPPGATWEAGKQYVALMRGGASGPQTLLGAEYLAMPTLYILREAALADLRLDLPENQGLIPGSSAEKAASGASLEPLRVAFKEKVLPLTQGLYAFSGCPDAVTCVDLPFSELVLVQSFKFAPGGTVTVGNVTDANPTVAAGAVGQVSAFKLDSTLSSATIAGLGVVLTAGNALVSDLFLSGASDCSGPALGRIPSPVAAPVLNTFSLLTGTLTVMPNVRADATTLLYLCATTSAAGTVSGFVAGGSAFPGTGFSVTGSDVAGTLTVTAAP